MKRFFPFLSVSAAAMLFFAAAFCSSQQVTPVQPSLTWDQIKAKFEAANPSLRADALGVDEMKAAEITAFLRPNPQLTVATDGTQIASRRWPR